MPRNYKEVLVRISERESRKLEKLCKEYNFSKTGVFRYALRELYRQTYENTSTSTSAISLELFSEQLSDIKKILQKVEEQGRAIQVGSGQLFHKRSSMLSDDLVIQRIEKIITSPKYRHTILQCKTVDELIDDIKKIESNLAPFLTPSPTRPITLLDEVLTSLEQKGIVVREMGVGLNWNAKMISDTQEVK
jgi:hypothetical protein